MIAVFGCEEEQFLPAEEAPQLSVNDGAEASHSPAAYAYVPEVLQEQVLAAVLPKGWTSSFGTKNADSLQARLSETLTKPTLRTTDSTGLETYSYHVPAEHPLQVINLVITADGDNLLEGSVFVYEMTAEFGAAFQQFEADFSTFEGSLKVFPLQALPKLFYDGLQKTEDDVTDCFELILSQKPVGPNGGGGGDNGGDNGPTGTVSTGDGPIGEGPSGGGGTCAVVITIPCGCDPAHQPGQHCACGTGNDGDEEHNQPYQVIIFVQCDDDDQKSNGDINGKSIDPEDCPQLLSSIGIVPRNLNELPGGEQLTEMIEAAVNETCFNQLAVNHILDLNTLASCTGGNPANGPDCITQQVVAYLNSLDLGGIPGTPLQIQFSESMPQHQLAAFLNAAVAGEGNEHVYAGMSYALTINNPILNSSSLAEVIIYLSVLSENSDSDATFSSTANDLLAILPIIDGDLSPLEIAWLIEDPLTIQTLSSIKSNCSSCNLVQLIQDGIQVETSTNSTALIEWIVDELFLTSFSIDAPLVYNDLINNFERHEISVANRIMLSALLMECFGEGDNDNNFVVEDEESFSNFKLTIYAQQAQPGSREPFIGGYTDAEWGHSFISLSALNSEDEPVNITFGYYPDHTLGKNDAFITTESHIYDNSRHAYNVSLEVDLDLDQFNLTMIGAIGLASEQYHTAENNCTNYAIDVANSSGALNIPITTQDFSLYMKTYGNGANPGDLGEDLRNMSGVGQLHFSTELLPAPSSTCR